jgi:hypothetical protein
MHRVDQLTTVLGRQMRPQVKRRRIPFLMNVNVSSLDAPKEYRLMDLRRKFMSKIAESRPPAAQDLNLPSKRWLPAAVAAFVIAAASANAAEAPVRTYSVDDSFEHVKEEVVDAIIKRGLVVDYTAHVSAMLERTAKDVGASKTPYAAAQSVQFCSATLSRRMMEADPINLAFCPHVIFVYALSDSPKTTHVGYRPLPRVGSKQSEAAIDAVNALLDGIAREATGRK